MLLLCVACIVSTTVHSSDIYGHAHVASDTYTPQMCTPTMGAMNTI